MRSRVLIVDDHRGFRVQARRLLESEGYEVVAEAPDVASAVEAARSSAPAIALVDVFLPDGNGFELTDRLVALPDPPEVILISSRDRGELEYCVDESPARGFIDKAELSREAIEEVLS